MSDQGKVKKRVFPVIFMLIVTLVFISITTAIYTITEDRIKINEKLVIKRAVTASAGLDVPDNPGMVEELYNKSVKEVKDIDGQILYYEVSDSKLAGGKSYVIISIGSGLWGDITAAVGIDSSRETLTGIEIINQNETPGLGGRITEAWFKDQFRGKKGPLTTVPEGEPAAEKQFQAITGASYSTGAIRSIVNSTLQAAQNRIKS